MQFEELKKLVSKGESVDREFKKTTGQRTEAAKTVVAMLNGNGGFVFFGVTDKGEIIGQQVSNKTLEDIAAEFRRIEPPAFPEIEIIPIKEDKKVIAIRVVGEKGTYTYDGRAYLRYGNVTQIMPKSEYEQRLIEKFHAIHRWENRPVPEGITLHDLDEEEIHRALANAVQKGRIEKPAHVTIESILTGFRLIYEG